MRSASESINRNGLYIMLTLVVIGLLVMMARGGGSTFFMIFWIAPAAFWMVRRYSGSCETGNGKRKNEFVKVKNETSASDAIGTLTTNDGEVMEIIEDRPARRHNDLI